LTVDCAIFGFDGAEAAILLIQRARPPFQGRWALPGGFVDPDEALELAAMRELEEETGISGLQLKQLAAYGDPGRDPRGHTVSVVFLGAADMGKIRATAGDDARAALWHRLSELPVLAFDHARIVADARSALRDLARQGAALFDLLPPTFTLTHLQRAFEAVTGDAQDKRNFRKKLAAYEILQPVAAGRATADKATAGRRYRLDRRRFAALVASGSRVDLRAGSSTS
jgi:8-oxo-dGTP diphosphatase